MTARILVVVDPRANLKTLEARLSTEYFDVLTALSGAEALAICEGAQCDIVLIETAMPDMDSFEVCRRLKSNAATHHIPVAMVTALDRPSDRVRGLEAGADDFLIKPIPDAVLMARVRSLVRLRMLTDELRMRALTSKEIGIENPAAEATADTGRNGRILLIDDCRASREHMAALLAREHMVDIEPEPSEALFHAAQADYDLIVTSLALDAHDGLRLCTQLRSLERTRTVPILALAEAEESPLRFARALEIGVNDFVVRPVDDAELMARARMQVRKRRYAERLRDNTQHSTEEAITDPLTTLHNRRYMERHLATLVDQAAARGKPLAVLVLDIDFFKAINESYGRDAGDDVLREFAGRLRGSIRGIDLACRSGGEEFVVVMPDTNRAVAAKLAESLRRRIASEPFQVQAAGLPVEVTVSVGISGLSAGDDTPAKVLKRADEALYRAQREGRNRVVADAA
ncbi:MAG: PleD family two-component system response regulator [Rhodoplanes sp.]